MVDNGVLWWVICMTVGELYELCQFHLRRQDLNKQDFYRVLNAFMKEALQRINFFSIVKSVKLIPDNIWCVPLPLDFYDDVSVVVMGKDTRLSLPLDTRISINDYLTLVGTSNMNYLRTSISASLPYLYVLARPVDVYTNLTEDDIPLSQQTVKCIIPYPPIDFNRYYFSLDYYPTLPEELNDDNDTHPVISTYPEWVLYEMLWRLFLAFGNPDLATAHKQIAAEKYLEVKAEESRRIMTPPKTLHLSQYYVRRRPTLRPPVPSEGRQIIRPIEIE